MGTPTPPYDRLDYSLERYDLQHRSAQCARRRRQQDDYPAGRQYTNLYMLGAMVNNIGASQTFTVTYTDGTTTQVTQNMSDWVYAAGWPGESVVNCNYDRNFDNGTTQADSVCVYGYRYCP
jgi:hypothetical protein